MLDLVERVGRLSGRRDFEPEFAPHRDGEVERNALDPTQAAQVLGFRAERTIEVGLEQTLAEEA